MTTSSYSLSGLITVLGNKSLLIIVIIIVVINDIGQHITHSNVCQGAFEVKATGFGIVVTILLDFQSRVPSMKTSQQETSTSFIHYHPQTQTPLQQRSEMSSTYLVLGLLIPNLFDAHMACSQMHTY